MAICQHETCKFFRGCITETSASLCQAFQHRFLGMSVKCRKQQGRVAQFDELGDMRWKLFVVR